MQDALALVFRPHLQPLALHLGEHRQQDAKFSALYSSILGWQIDVKGGIKTPGGLAGTVGQDPAEKIVYMGMPDIAAVLKASEASGGKTALPRTVVPSIVTFALFTDPAGSRMGLVKIKP